MQVHGKVAIVTGAASGFGRGIAARLAAEGASVVVADVDGAGAETAAAEIAERGGAARAVQVDVTVADQVRGMVAAALEGFGGLDIVVNNAGVPQSFSKLEAVEEEVFDRIYAVNVKSLYLSAREVVPVLRERGGGVILNTASTGAQRPRPGLTWYNGSKGAVVAITKAMAIELARYNIRVNALCPVAGATPMAAAFTADGVMSPEVEKQTIASIPLKRLCTPEDMGAAALYLASEDAAFITGVCLDVDGGRSI